ncbi:polyprenol phosphomannose-dependent alpha 1,6 mannosyltransferase MptB [Umezawaea sp. NPDC059074]|uniref:polyprenol phosphomannose-dependent alpha 1,6 mannosyltransferase MptB n=1 Tax=Umezawaea sp. NPDC059074 TaxID=3346716 RepID=UPI00369BDE2F
MSLSAIDRRPITTSATPSSGGVDVLRWTGFGGVVLLTGAAWTGTVALAAGVAGVGLLVLSWALLGRSVLAGRPRPSARWLKRTLVLWCGPLLVAPPLFSLDLYSYLAQGEVAARGLDPNAVGPATGLGATADAVQRVGGYWQDTPSPYGPLFGAVERLIAQVSAGDPVVGVLLHRVVEVLGLALIVWAVPRLAGASGRAALWLGVLNPLVLWHLVAGAHNDSLMLGLMLAGTAVALGALREGVDWWPLAFGVGLIALAAEVKLPALVALAVVGTALARRRGGGFVLVGLGMAGAFLVVSVGVSVLTGLGFGWVRVLGTSGLVASWMAPTNWFGFAIGGIGSLFGADLTTTMIGVGKVVGYVLAAGVIAVVLHRQLRGRVDAVTALGLVLAAVVLLGPVVQPWYLLWAVVPLAVAPVTTLVRARLAAVVAVFAVLVPPLAGNFSGRVGQLVVGYAVGILVVGAAFLLLRRKSIEKPRSRV